MREKQSQGFYPFSYEPGLAVLGVHGELVPFGQHFLFQAQSGHPVKNCTGVIFSSPSTNVGSD